MQFYTVSDTPRPVRLCETTRKFAYDSLHYQYGKDTWKTPNVILEDSDLPECASLIDKYDAAIKKIAETAPIRICKEERISGAATLGDAMRHYVPALYKGEYICFSVSHLTTDFKTVIEEGYSGLFERAKKSLAAYSGTDRERFLKSAILVLRSFETYHKRNLAALENRADKQENYRNLLRVPAFGATNFFEAVQSLWFTFSFMRLCGNWPGIGRIDVLLGKYLKQDLKSGILNLDQAREILAHFFIKGCEWVCGNPTVSGDAQFYQNIVLSGIDENGNDVTNEVTFLVLDIIEELGISDFPVTVRLSPRSDEKLIKRVAEVISHGGGVVAVYNEPLILESLKKYGYPAKEAASFANDGCWEIQIPGKTNFTYIPFDGLAILQKITLKSYENTNFGTFEELYAAYIRDLTEQTENIFINNTTALLQKNENGFTYKPNIPCTVVSVFENDCIARGLSYLEGGAVYNVISPHFGGFADAVNALYALKKVVFDDKLISFEAFLDVLKNNWTGHEPLREYVKNKYEYYGNDSDEADRLAARLADDFAAACKKLDGRSPIMFPPGISTFGRQIEWANGRPACPHGRKCGEVLAGNASPTPATDKEGATAIIKSYGKLPLEEIVNGAALDVHLLPDSTNGKEGITAIESLLRGFLACNGQFMQIDVSDKKMLLDAQKHPENYQTLSVRVSGWNARFVTLNREWQNMIIERI